MLKRLFGRIRKANTENASETALPQQKKADLMMDNRIENGVKSDQNADPQQIQRLQKMGDRLHLVLRMAAMNMLREETGGFVMEVDGSVMRMPDAGTLFEAYLVLEEMYGDDWSSLDDALNAPWTREVIHMVLDPEKYIGVWRAMRMRVISEALPMLRKYGGDGQKDERNSKFFTMLCIHICEKVIDTLRRSDAKDQ